MLSSISRRSANEETDTLRAAAKDRGDLAALLGIADKENSELREQSKLLSEQNKSLHASLDLAQENFRAIGLANEESDTEEAEGTSTELLDFEPSSLEEAVVAAKGRFYQTLFIQDSALDSARESPFMQHKKVYQALLAMHEVCLAWRESRRNNSNMGTFEQAFAQRGFVYKSRESMTSRGKWGEEYESLYKGRRISIEPHLALGKGGPDTCLRIHFYQDDDEEKFIVAHVGRHKTNTRS